MTLRSMCLHTAAMGVRTSAVHPLTRTGSVILRRYAYKKGDGRRTFSRPQFPRDLTANPHTPNTATMSTRRISAYLPDEEVFGRSARFHNSFLIAPDEALEFARKNSGEKGLPEIAVSPAEGKFLHLLVRTIGAKRILEVGTLGGYSSIWMGRALPEGGEIISLELSDHHAQVARENVAKAGLGNVVKIIQGPAADSLKTLQPGDEPFDFVFIDADKDNNLTYLLEAKRLTRKGAVIIVDNTVREGAVADLSKTDGPNEGVRKLLAHLKTDTELSATTVSTIGERVWDGFTYILKL
ncbi:S-adenosyl-L-methionine-dependent methyltransferase [Rhodofomes roseus]|uniref:S-adenosyl-L-methionine-dependent methyltransferase n=1 Tax=Rhodofomes roseus TaxID=34475 RepID=A0ABQ8KW93_9APHY|nr:S-adenosyl-L-methionine-dependent methyltransferase [Rhodofomes roseus]KAH9842799.1 S-adenosyl-L-methionine-dependent methyltransferase [Rhodofomes roseus]